MKEKIANWLLRLARWLCPQKEFTLAEIHEPKKLGIGYHITKKDVRDYRKQNPQFKSHRQALNAMIEDTKKEILMNIMAGALHNELVNYKVRKTLYVADVTGDLYVYVPKEKNRLNRSRRLRRSRSFTTAGSAVM